jgi:hypothetical protein
VSRVAPARRERLRQIVANPARRLGEHLGLAATVQRNIAESPANAVQILSHSMASKNIEPFVN